MSAAVLLLLIVAGLSEAVGRVLPVVAGRSGASRAGTAGLLLTGTVIDAAVFALWPLLAGALAGGTLTWTPGLVAPLLLAAVLAFPLLGPFLHAALITGVGAGLAGALATGTGLGWWPAAGWVAVAGIGLAGAVEIVRRLVIRFPAPRAAS